MVRVYGLSTCIAIAIYMMIELQLYRMMSIISTVMQMLMSVRLMTPTTVMRMHSALTLWETSPVLANLATLEMESPVQVS